MKYIIIGFTLFLFWNAYTVVGGYLNLPEVAKTESGDCVWIREAPDFEKRVCPLKLPEKYTQVYVHYNDKVGE